jgi:integrase
MPMQKPAKPYPEFPLFAHNNGQWAKKIKGRFVFFGSWKSADWDTALARYLEERDALYAGRPVDRNDPAEMTCDEWLNSWAAEKLDAAETGRIGPQQAACCVRTARFMLAATGAARPVASLDHAALLKIRKKMPHKSPITLKGHLTRARMAIRWLERRHGIQVRLDDELAAPPKRAIRLHSAARRRFWQPDEIAQILATDNLRMRAVLSLVANCAFETHDLAALSWSHIEQIDDRWYHTCPRPKTGLPRLAMLWPRTVEAMEAADLWTPEANGLIVRSQTGGPVWRENPSGLLTDLVSRKARTVIRHQLAPWDSADDPRNGIGTLGLRHSFRTIADAVMDRDATELIMGHAPGHIADGNAAMAATYRHRIGYDRVRAVAEFVEASIWTA